MSASVPAPAFSIQHDLPTLAYRDVPSRRWLPFQSLMCSYIFHAALVIFVAMLPPGIWFAQRVQLRNPLSAAELQNEVLTLPAIGGGSEGQEGGHAGAGGAPAGRGSAPPRRAGTVYKGSQPIVSDPPNPDNHIQTIQQPDLVNPPKLRFPIAAPNMVLMASAGRTPILAKQAPPPPPPVVPVENVKREVKASGIPIAAAQAPPPEPVEPPKLQLPPPGVDSAEAQKIQQLAAVKPTRPAAPATANPHVTDAGGQDSRNLLVISGISMPISGRGITIPPGVASGSFTVATEAPGPKLGDGSGAGTGTGNSGAPGAGNGAGKTPGTGTGTGGVGSGAGSGSGPGGGRGPGTGAGTGSGTGTGRGSGPGTGVGNGTGSGTGTGGGTGPGTGSGTGPGAGPFKDITIKGGAASGVAGAGGGKPTVPTPRQYSYGMSVVASGSSGGGLRDFGVFQNEAVYTVYLEPDAHVPGPHWVLQYAFAKSEGPGAASIPPGGVLVPPYLISREATKFPAEIAAKNAGRMLVANGVINASGKMDRIHVLQVPNPLLIQPLLDALSACVFRPAELNGQPVAVKIVIGVPIVAPAQ